MTLLTRADTATAGARRATVRLDEDPAGAARARVTSPSLLGLADHRHADRWWRDLRLDAALHGVAAQRAQPTSLVIEHRGGEWPLPVPGLLGCALAWSPFAPRVAGLAVAHGRAHPWIADYAERSLRIVAPVRAATSLTGLERGGAAAPLCWLDAHTLGFLAAVAPAPAPTPTAAAVSVEAPLIYDASGPGFVSFEPELDELLAATGAAIARLDLRDKTVDTLTGPLLVCDLRPSDGLGRGLLVRHATDLRRGGRDGLVWSDARLDLSRRPTALEPVAGGAVRPAARSRAAARSAERPPGSGVAPRLSSSTRALAVPGLEHAARLAVFAQPPDAGPHAATLLWIRASRGPLDCGAPVPAPLPDTATPTATLDLPLHWPADATRDALHDQIVGAVRAAAAALADAPIVVGGHSFGATLALYALAHVPGLAGAIAHSGCYNRTHTPYGFHYERRRYWDAPEIYDAFSALRFADRIRRPVLIAHGLQDANPATHPDQAAQLYRAIVATAGTARLVLLPREEHNFRYRETHARLTRIHREWLERAADAR
jgi:dienelactone hydrolase